MRRITKAVVLRGLELYPCDKHNAKTVDRWFKGREDMSLQRGMGLPLSAHDILWVLLKYPDVLPERTKHILGCLYLEHATATAPGAVASLAKQAIAAKRLYLAEDADAGSIIMEAWRVWYPMRPEDHVYSNDPLICAIYWCLHADRNAAYEVAYCVEKTIRDERPMRTLLNITRKYLNTYDDEGAPYEI